MLILYGAVLQKNQTMATMQQLIFNAAETKFSVFSNYLSGLLSSPDRMYIDVEFEGIQLLNYARESALSKGIITDEEQEVSVKAKLSVGSEVYKVVLSPTGQNLDMIGSIDKRAYKVRVLEGKKIYGMEEFKLLPPISRNNIVEWVGHALENKEGLILACSALSKDSRSVLGTNRTEIHLVYLKGSKSLIKKRMVNRNHFMPSSLLDSQFLELSEPTNALVIDINQKPNQRGFGQTLEGISAKRRRFLQA